MSARKPTPEMKSSSSLISPHPQAPPLLVRLRLGPPLTLSPHTKIGFIWPPLTTIKNLLWLISPRPPHHPRSDHGIGLAVKMRLPSTRSRLRRFLLAAPMPPEVSSRFLMPQIQPPLRRLDRL